MATLDKQKAAFRACRGPYPFSDFEAMIGKMGYVSLGKGRTGGSRRKFYNQQSDHLLVFHEPHGKDLGAGTVSNLRDDLIGAGAL